jgi:single-stranded-DNA-specific exonuclease
LDRLNSQRQDIQKRLVELCLQQLPDQPPDFAVLWGEEDDGWHRGVVGIAAARVRDAINRPVAIIALSGQDARGSVRSIPEVHAVQALGAAEDLLLRFGGHPAAAGFSLERAQLPALRERLNEHARQCLSGQKVVPTIVIDAECTAQDITHRLLQDLNHLEPHGKGNPAPLLLIQGVRPSRAHLISDGKHLKFRVDQMWALWWNAAEHLPQLNQPVDIVARPSFNHWQGQTSIQLMVEDIRVATPH